MPLLRTENNVVPVPPIAPQIDAERQIRYESAATFLRGLFEPTDTVFIFLLHEETKATHSFTQTLEQTIDEASFELLDEWQAKGWHVYTCMNPLQPGSKTRSKELVAAIRTAYLDIDKNGPEQLAELNKAVEAGEVPAPRFVVESSPNKYQISWRLVGASKEQQEALLDRLIARFGGDSAASDCSRVFRLPGFKNLKPEYDSPVAQIVEQNDSQTTLDQFGINGTSESKPAKEPYSYTMPEPGTKISENRNIAVRDFAFNEWVYENCTEEELRERVYLFNDTFCQPPLEKSELDSTVLSSTPKKQQRKDLIPLFNGVPGGTTQAPVVAASVSKVQIIESTGVAPEIEEIDSDAIPEFDQTIITGLAAKCVELARRGTTLLPQFVYQTFRALLGSRMAGKVKFDLLDDEPLYHIAFIGETGSGKSEAVARMMQIFKPIGLVGNAGFKFTSGIDSGAGLKDLFFEPPEHLPVVCHVDEIATIGHAAHSTRNPSILDVIGELANGRRISRTLVKRNGGSKSKDDARLTVIYCGQEGAVYANAFAGRALLGMWDRLYPEYGIAVEPGDKPPIDPVEACKLKEQIDALDYSGTVSMGIPAKAFLDDYWDSLPVELRKKARFRRNLMLDAYLEAFQNGRRTVEIPDAKVATKLFDRTTAIRRKEFAVEVPDQIGRYIGLLKKETAKMEAKIQRGVPAEFCALSKRDYETLTNAFRLNELHIFNKAWQAYAQSYLRVVTIKKQNGQEYAKFLPAFQDDGRP